MATTSPDTLRTPDPGDSYNLVADLAILGQDVQNALTRRANAYTGTPSQRAAFTTAPVGTLWQDNDTLDLLWRMGPTGWLEMHPATAYSLASGSISSSSWTVLSNQASWSSSGSTATWTNGYVVPRSGLYSITVTARVGANISIFAAIKLNNTAASPVGVVTMSASTGFAVEAATSATRVISLTGGDVLTPAIYTSGTGGPYTLTASSTSFSVTHIR